MPQTNERRRELYKQNRENVLARNRKYRKAHKEAIATWMKEYHKAYYSENQDAIKAAAIEYKKETKYSAHHIKLRLLRFAKYRAKKMAFRLTFLLMTLKFPNIAQSLELN